MGDDSEIAELRRRVALIEKDVDGERTVSRHMLRKLGDVENAILDLTKAVAELSKSVAETQKSVSRLEDFVMVSQAELPRKFAEIAALVMREEMAKRK
jgi:uncharacterized coiled-coil protein SlyX